MGRSSIPGFGACRACSNVTDRAAHGLQSRICGTATVQQATMLESLLQNALLAAQAIVLFRAVSGGDGCCLVLNNGGAYQVLTTTGEQVLSVPSSRSSL